MTIKPAREVREMMPQSTEETMARLGTLIEKAAKEGKDRLRVPYDLFTTEQYSAKFKNPEIQPALERLGFFVSSRSECRQFVDVWLEIVWGLSTDA